MKKRTIRKTATITLIGLILIIPIIEAENMELKKESSNTKIDKFGSIFGKVYWCPDPIIPDPQHLPLALVKAGIRRTRCNLRGEYQLNGLPIGKTFEVKARFLFINTESKTVRLTEDMPSKRVDLFHWPILNFNSLIIKNNEHTQNIDETSASSDISINNNRETLTVKVVDQDDKNIPFARVVVSYPYAVHQKWTNLRGITKFQIISPKQLYISASILFSSKSIDIVMQDDMEITIRLYRLKIFNSVFL